MSRHPLFFSPIRLRLPNPDRPYLSPREEPPPSVTRAPPPRRVESPPPRRPASLVSSCHRNLARHDRLSTLVPYTKTSSCKSHWRAIAGCAAARGRSTVTALGCARATPRWPSSWAASPVVLRGLGPIDGAVLFNCVYIFPNRFLI
jgi:hypothetical protein